MAKAMWLRIGVLTIWIGAIAGTDVRGDERGVFVDLLGGDATDVVNCVTKLSDGGFAVTGYTTGGSTSGRNVLLAKLSPEGNLAWSKVFGGGGDEEGHSVIQTSDGHLVMVGYTESRGDGADFLLGKYDASNGGSVWVRTWGEGSGYDEELHGVIQAQDGTLWTTGYTESHVPQGRKKVVIAKILPGGTSLTCARAGKVADNWDVSGYALAEVFDTNGFCVTGTLIDHDLTGDLQDVLLVKFNHDPDYLWGDRIGDSGQEYETGTSIVRTSDGCLALAGRREWWDGIYMNYGGFILKTDTLAAVDWAYRTGGGPGYTKDVRSVVETEDGGLVIAGTDTYISTEQALLAKWTLAGTSVWNRKFGYEDKTLQGYSLVEHADPSLLVAGVAAGYGGMGAEEIALANCNSMGWTCLPCEEGPTFSPWSPAQASIDLVSENEYTLSTSVWLPTHSVYDMGVTALCKGPIPAVSEWGLVVMVLLGMTGGTIMFRARLVARMR